MTKQVDVTVEISTKDRYFTTLPMTLSSVATQTVLPKRVLIFDDGEQRDLRQEPTYSNLFGLFHVKGISCEVIFGQRKGQVMNHQSAIEIAQTEWIWRLDDDDVPEADALEKMMRHIADDVGGISGLILLPNMAFPSSVASGKIEHVLTRPNVQWSRFHGVKEVDHFNNSFLFRKAAASHGYCMEMSPVGHREETLFTYGIRRAGYRLLVDPEVVIWHLRAPQGGIRSYENAFLWEHDERVFLAKMAQMGVRFEDTKYVVLNSGIGDHYAFKMMLPELKDKCEIEGRELVVAACFPEVFEDDGIKLISIAEAQQMNLENDQGNIYWWMIHHGWKGRVVDAYRKMLL